MKRFKEKIENLKNSKILTWDKYKNEMLVFKEGGDHITFKNKYAKKVIKKLNLK